LSESDRRSGWPEAEQRQGERRSGKDRRVQSADRPPGEERRRHDRRSGTDRRNEALWETVSLDVAVASFAPADGLIAAALQARTFAHARYSGFQVGAALETDEGRVVTGCNIENATYGLTLCAERVALVKALSEGCGVFTRIAVVADSAELTPPCGACRQLLWEYCGDLEIILANPAGGLAMYRLASLLPLPFDNRLL
jgi:cytidine deaminase